MTGQQVALVDARSLFVTLIDLVAHHKLQLAFAGSECEFLCLFGSNLEGNSLDAIRFAFIFRLVDVLTVGKNLDVLQHDLGNRILHAGTLARVDGDHYVYQRAWHDEAGDARGVVNLDGHCAVTFRYDSGETSRSSFGRQSRFCDWFAHADVCHCYTASQFFRRVKRSVWS